MDDMLAAFTPAEFDERLAAERVDGSPPDWIERLATILKMGFASMSMAGMSPDAFDPLRPRVASEPGSNPLKAGSDSAGNASLASQAVSPNQAAAMFAVVAGPPRV